MSTKYERILWIDEQIRANRYPNVLKVQDRFELRGRSTVFNDLKFMKNRLGAPIRYSRFHQGWHYTDPSYFLPSIFLTREEVLAFFLGEELFKRYLGTSFERPLRMALDKIKQHLPEHVGYDMQAEVSSFAFTGGATVEVNPGVLADLNQAVLSKRQVKMVYYSAESGETSTRVVDPYHLHNIRGDWYLIALCHKREEIRNFLVGRIREWKILPSVFQVESGFSLEGYLDEHFLAERGEELIDVVIKFDEYQARWIRERQWHPSQQMEELPSGELILRLKVSGLREVKRWIMGYGPHAEVLQPENLRSEFRKEAAEMKKIYDKK